MEFLMAGGGENPALAKTSAVLTPPRPRQDAKKMPTKQMAPVFFILNNPCVLFTFSVFLFSSLSSFLRLRASDQIARDPSAFYGCFAATSWLRRFVRSLARVY
jgi:hypothetical protein